MIQRKQSLYLLLGAILNLVCLFLPLGSFELKGMGVSPVLYNLALVDYDGVYNFAYCPLFVTLALSGIIALVTVFLYKNRPLQMRLCSISIALILIWMILHVVFMYTSLSDIGEYNKNLTTVFPFISAILFWLAYKGVRHDEQLVKSADRIR